MRSEGLEEGGDGAGHVEWHVEVIVADGFVHDQRGPGRKLMQFLGVGGGDHLVSQAVDEQLGAGDVQEHDLVGEVSMPSSGMRV